MSGILNGMRVVEGSAFVAVPLAGMTLAQMGAEVIRFDRLQGGLDAGRWPLAPNGQSLFWDGMNKGKKIDCDRYERPAWERINHADHYRTWRGRGPVLNKPARARLDGSRNAITAPS